ncbi:MAG: sulfatase-like hydrolase/transferase [Candidatus Aminicenantaceae bacterium]
MEKIRSLLFLILAVFFLLLVANPPLIYPGAKSQSSKLNLILITIDTLRADRLSCYSSAHLDTPHIDSLTEKGALFTRAFAHTSTTLPSHTNILLGTTPLSHGVHDNNNFVVRDEFLTLAELLKSHGYSTGAFVGAFLLDSAFGLAQGFDTYDDDFSMPFSGKEEAGERKGQIVIDRALAWINKVRSPWFLWIHCWDPHDPYAPPEPFRTQFADHLYEGEVAYIDYIMGKLINYLEEKGLFESTSIIFTGDHGESLGDHGEITHGHLAYNSTIWIPFFIYVPGMKPRRIDQNVAHIDIFPTVCEILHVKKPEFLSGVSLLPLLKGKKLPKRHIYFESLHPYYGKGWAPIRGFIHGTNKYIDSPLPELYDLKKDFSEHQNLAEQMKVDEYSKQLDLILRTHSYKGKGKAQKRMDRETVEKLESLGYISTYQGRKKDKFGPDDDVKVLLPYHNKSARALELAEKGYVKEGMEILKQVITERTNISTAYIYLSQIYKDLGQMENAIEVLKMGREFIPLNYKIFARYCDYLYESDRLEDAMKAFEETNFQEVNYDPNICHIIGIGYWERGNVEAAQAFFEKSILFGKKFPIPYYFLGSIHLTKFMKTKDLATYEKAISNLKKAVDLDPSYSTAYKNLGIAHVEAGKYEEAIPCLEKAWQLNPDLHQSLYYLGLAYMHIGNYSRAYSCFSRFKITTSYEKLSQDAKFKLESYLQQCKPSRMN